MKISTCVDPECWYMNKSTKCFKKYLLVQIEKNPKMLNALRKISTCVDLL